MTVELSKEEIEIIAGWYAAATAPNCVRGEEDLPAVRAHFQALEKLGIRAKDFDLSIAPEEFITKSQAVARAVLAEIEDYKKRTALQ